MEREKNNNSNNRSNKVFIGTTIALLILVLCLAGYIFLNKDNIKYITGNNNTNAKNETVSKNNDKTTNSSDNNTSTSTDNNSNNSTPSENTNTTNSIVSFDSTKAINSSQKNYTLACQGSFGIYITVDASQKVMDFSFTPSRVVENYPLNWTSTNNSISHSEIKFTKKIIDVFFGGMGQSSTGDTVFILLEDGTVEYIPIVHALNHAQGAVISYGAIDGISGVTKFTLANTSGSVTTLAIKSDGTFYDLWYALKDTGNY